MHIIYTIVLCFSLVEIADYTSLESIFRTMLKINANENYTYVIYIFNEFAY